MRCLGCLKNNWGLSFLLFLTTSVSFSQVRLAGKTVERNTGSPVAFASLVLVTKFIGVTSDETGFFKFTLETISEKDSIVVSCIGYKSVKVSVRELLNSRTKSQNDSVTITLDTNPVVLSEFKISDSRLKFDVGTFMKEVVKTYNRNRRTTPHIAKALVCEKAKLEGKYIMFSEALGYSIFLGDSSNWAEKAKYKFYPQNMRKSIPDEKWVAYKKNLKSDLAGNDVLYGGSGTLAAFKSLEVNGILSTENYNYSLFKTYNQGYLKVFVIEFKGKGEQGTMEVYGNDYHIKEITCHGAFIWATTYHKQVRGDLSVSFDYFNDQAFVKQIETYYSTDKLEHWTELEVLVQKYDDFKVTNSDISKLVAVSNDPYVLYEPDDWGSYSLANNQEREMVVNDLSRESSSLETQFKTNSGKQYLGGEMNTSSTAARKVIDALKILF